MPTDTFSVAASGDDGFRGQTNPDNTWPPVTTQIGGDATTDMRARKVNHQTFVFTEAAVMLMRFDTSALPDNAIISAAVLRLNIIAKADANNRSLAGEWYASSNWPIDSGDYVLDVGTDAIPGTDITGLTAGADNDFTLSNPTNVNKTGFTGFRLGVTGGDPGQPGDNDNSVTVATFDHATLAEPRLLVTYTIPQSARPTADSVDGNWTNQADSNVNLFDSIDEVSASDTDYIKSETQPSSSGCRVKLGSLTDPASSTGHTISWRASKSGPGGTMNMVVTLRQGGGAVLGGGTLIASFTRNGVPEAWTTYAETLSGAQADTITDYADLYLEFYATEV